MLGNSFRLLALRNSAWPKCGLQKVISRPGNPVVHVGINLYAMRETIGCDATTQRIERCMRASVPVLIAT